MTEVWGASVEMTEVWAVEMREVMRAVRSR
jgi:hypothetical protein